MPTEEAFSNPLAPADVEIGGEGGGGRGGDSHSSRHALTNADFRKYLETPRVSSSATQGSHSSGSVSQPHRASHIDVDSSGKAGGVANSGFKRPSGNERKKKKAHIKSKKEEDEDDLNAILKKYRDRARERRVGESKEADAEADIMKLSSGYRAMAPDARSIYDAAERRKQMIQESKYLGGDMEHTHLVKGLDYALLQKVRSEITSKEQEEEELDKIYLAGKTDREEVEANMQSTIAKSIYRILFKNELPKNNELFAPRRMAYVIDLDDDFGATDIPNTLIRSKADCPVDEATTNLSTNDLVIQKLTQVLSYLRTDTKRKKKEKIEAKADEQKHTKEANQSIFDDAGDYIPNLKKSDANATSKKEKAPYFDRPTEPDEEESRRRDRRREPGARDRRENERGREGDRKRDRDRRNDRDKTGDLLQQGWAPADISLEKQQQAGRNPATGLTKEEKDKGYASVFKRGDFDPAPNLRDKTKQLDVGYAECYPGGLEEMAGDESDEEGEADFTKMDMGNKKGPIRRWDFDTEEQYEDYMSRREAMPKAAFQYGQKMNDGRKTRKLGAVKGEKDNKQKLDKEWQKISKILERKESEPSSKRPKY